jgi:hypothetical protein
MLGLRTARRGALIISVIASVFAVATCRDVQEPVAPALRPTPAPNLSASVTTGSAVLVGAGDISSCSNANDEATAKLLDAIAGEVFTLGDNAYVDGTAAEYANCYDPTWGRHKARTHPAAGDKDYTTPGAPDYFAYFGTAAGDPAKGYYSYDVGDWHVIVLNSKVSMTATSEQIAWLKADLKASGKACTIAYWHKPRFSSSNSVWATAKPAWDALYTAGVEIVLNADRKNYERFAPQNPDGVADPALGIRQFVVGTGGASSTLIDAVAPNSEVRIVGTPGVLKLTLDVGSYSWEFVPIAGKTATDQGAGTCGDGPPPVANPGGPYSSERTVSFNGSASLDPQGDVPLTYEWSFGDGATGTGVSPTYSYEAEGTYTVTLVVVDAKGNRSAPATTTVVIGNLPPKVEAGAELWVTERQNLPYAGSFSDLKGSPWVYRINWGDNTIDHIGIASAAGEIAASHRYVKHGDYTITVTVTEAGGNSSSDHTVVHVMSRKPDITLLGAGDIAECGANQRDEETGKLIDAEIAIDPAAVVFTFGDNAYPSGRPQDYANCYEPAWGRHKDRTYANLGNHDYDTGTADPTWDYFGERAGPRGKGYYSVDLGNWHIIVLNDNRSFVPFAEGSEQDKWLVADLAANKQRCILAIWHHPRFYSAETAVTVRTSWKILWDRLWAAGADLVLNGHQHRYERFAPMRPDGTRDDATGIREIIVGTGGEGTAPLVTRAPNSEVTSESIGIIKLVLTGDGYDWQFIPAPGYTFTDSGSGTCH